MSSKPAPPAQNSKMPDLSKSEIPRDQSLPAQAASPLATLSSHADPYPHYIMSGACAVSAFRSYNTLQNPRLAAIKGALSVAYLWAGRLVYTGHPHLGYDIGTITSAGLLAVAFPTARATADAGAVAMSALGGVSFVANLIKSYQQRAGKPLEMNEK